MVPCARRMKFSQPCQKFFTNSPKFFPQSPKLIYIFSFSRKLFFHKGFFCWQVDYSYNNTAQKLSSKLQKFFTQSRKIIDLYFFRHFFLPKISSRQVDWSFDNPWKFFTTLENSKSEKISPNVRKKTSHRCCTPCIYSYVRTLLFKTGITINRIQYIGPDVSRNQSSNFPRWGVWC